GSEATAERWAYAEERKEAGRDPRVGGHVDVAFGVDGEVHLYGRGERLDRLGAFPPRLDEVSVRGGTKSAFEDLASLRCLYSRGQRVELHLVLNRRPW